MSEPAEIEPLLRAARTIAVAGLSSDPLRPSHGVARYLMRSGYRVIPVNPRLREVLGEKAYPDLESVPVPVDIVNIFRRPSAVAPVVDAAIRIGARAVWMQDGVVDEASAARARAAGLTVVMDRCIATEHRRYLGSCSSG